MPEVSGNPLGAFGWNDRVLALFNALASPLDEPARVARVERSRSVVVCADGLSHYIQTPSALAVGDWVAMRESDIQLVLPRWSTLTRGDPDGVGVQILAANVDLVIITAPADRINPTRVERELAIAWDSGARPLVVLTKADVAPVGAMTSLQSRLAGVDVLSTSAASGAGVGALAEMLRPDRTAVLLGPSGAGKSTLANSLIGAGILATGAVREGDHRGRHTTTSRQLVAVPGGGVLIDTPGLRSLGLAGDALALTFPDIDELAVACRFSDCRHGVEPGCAVVGALACEKLGAERLTSFRKLKAEVLAGPGGHDPLQRKVKMQTPKSRIKSARMHSKRRPR